MVNSNLKASVWVYRLATSAMLIGAVFGCEEPTSTSVYGGSKPVIFDNSDTWPTTDRVIKSMSIAGNRLLIEVECPTVDPTRINFVGWNYWMMSSPVQMAFRLSMPPANGWTPLSRYTLVFDLTPLKEKYLQSFDFGPRIIILNVRYDEDERRLVWYYF